MAKKTTPQNGRDRLEEAMAMLIQNLLEHTRLLERLNQAIRDKIGFKLQPEP